MTYKITDNIDANGFSCHSDIEGYCDICKDDIDGTLECPYEDHCFYKCYSAYNKILQKIRGENNAKTN